MGRERKSVKLFKHVSVWDKHWYLQHNTLKDGATNEQQTSTISIPFYYTRIGTAINKKDTYSKSFVNGSRWDSETTSSVIVMELEEMEEKSETITTEILSKTQTKGRVIKKSNQMTPIAELCQPQNGWSTNWLLSQTNNIYESMDNPNNIWING